MKVPVQRMLVSFLTLIAVPVLAGTLTVRVVDPDAVPVPDVAVYVMHEGSDLKNTAPLANTVMDQVDTQFVPHLLLVRKGTAVEFPNSDIVAHHVYSFSKPNNFVLPLYKGEAHDPVEFSHDGIVTIGCNIHDAMLAYIVVVDTDAYAMTNDEGVAEISIGSSASDYEVNIWSPRIRDGKQLLAKRISVSDTTDVVFKLQKSLRRPNENQSESLEWTDY